MSELERHAFYDYREEPGPQASEGSDRVRAGEPPGEPALPPEILQAIGDDLRSKLPDELADELLEGANSEEEIVGPGGSLSRLTNRPVERAMEVEWTDHLGYEPHQEPPGATGTPCTGRPRGRS
jgi:hypothetical protein